MPRNLSTNLASFLERITDHPAAPKVKAAIGACHSVAERFADKADALARGGTLTVAGHRQAMADALTKEFGPALRKAREPLAKLRIEATAKRNSIGFAAPDRTDIVGELQRQEIRAHLRSLNYPARNQLALTTKDKLIREAIATAPPALSGLTDNVYGEAVNFYKAEAFGPQFEEIEALDRIVAEGEAAATIARMDLHSASGLDAGEFATIMKPLDDRPFRMWRDATTAKVLMFDPDRGARQATPDEILAGEVYETAEAFRAAMAAEAA